MWGEWGVNDTHKFPLDAMRFPRHLRCICEATHINFKDNRVDRRTTLPMVR